MVFKRIAIPLLVLLAFASGATAAEFLPGPDGSAAPALSLADLGGRQHNLSDYHGKVVLVNFWATWCSPCLIEMPGMQRLKSHMKARPFAILAVNVQQEKTTVWRFMNLLKVDFPALLDSDGDARDAWQVDFYPSSFLVDSEGNVRYTAYGMIDWDSDETRRLIETLMPDGDTVPATSE